MAITNEQVVQHFKSNGKNSALDFIKTNAPLQSGSFQPCETSYDKSLKTLIDKFTKLNKSKNRQKGAVELKTFIEKLYIFPQGNPDIRGPHVTCDDSLNIKDSLVYEKNKTQILTQKLVVSEIVVQEKEEVLASTNLKLTSCKLKLKRTAARESYAQTKIIKLEDNVVGNCCQESQDRIRDLEKQLFEKCKEITDLSTNCEYLEGLLNDFDSTDKIVTLYDEKSKRYVPSFKNCVYKLLKYGVSASSVGEVVKSVLNLVNFSPNKLPSKPTVLNMSYQRACVSHKQLIDVFAKEENTCLLTDETSKFGSKYMGYEATDSTGGLWVLGLREIETKSADDTLKVFKQILSDLDSVQSTNDVSRNIISHISATMSDRAATELKFNDLLESYRKEVLPLTYHNYETFTDEEKSSIESLNNFFCGLHALVNYAEASQKCILQVEQDIFGENQPISDPSFKSNSEPGVCRLIRTASKAFGEGSGGDEKSGCQGHFKTFVSDFLQEEHMKAVPLKSYRGARFNILFNNASFVFFLHQKMIQFLESYGAENRLLKSILFDLKVPEFIAGIKSLGLINKFITAPLWSVLEDRTISIENMNVKYHELTTFLEDAVKNVDQFMTGNLVVFDEHVKRDCFLEKLIQPQTYDQIVQTFLEVILSALAKLAHKLYKEHLPGGKLTTNPIKAKSAPKTSCFAESVFGQMDHIIRTKPNISTLAVEASIMFANNRTVEWLDSKNTTHRDEIIQSASRQVPSLKRKFKTRINEIAEHRQRVLQEKIQKKERTRQEQIRKKENFTHDILHHGLWQSHAEVDQMLEGYTSDKQKLEALTAQLKFRKQVLLQVPEVKTTFNLTKPVEGKKSRKPLSVEEFTSNLKLLIHQAIVKDKDNDDTKHMLVGKRIKHRFEVEENKKKVSRWFTGKVISQVPWFRDWFNVVYDDDDAVYTLKHLDNDFEREDLKILVL